MYLEVLCSWVNLFGSSSLLINSTCLRNNYLSVSAFELTAGYAQSDSVIHNDYAQSDICTGKIL